VSFSPLPSLAVYHADCRSLEVGAVGFVPLRDSSSFICISSALSSWKTTGGMQI
jgi:hypothetical protein